MTDRELLRIVELPLALPSIAAGIRVAAVVGVGAATIAAAIGAGGLGEYIYRGLSMVDTTVILAGAIPAAALALLVDGSVARRRAAADRAAPFVTPRRAGCRDGRGAFWRSPRARRSPAAAPSAVVVGSKNFTEQLILGELVAQTIERAGIRVERRLNLGGTLICDRALAGGDIDVYVEYTGTALTAVFQQPLATDLNRLRDRAGAVCANGPDAPARSGLQQHLRDSRARRRRRRAAAQDHRRSCARRAAVARRLRLRVPRAPRRLSRPGAAFMASGSRGRRTSWTSR